MLSFAWLSKAGFLFSNPMKHICPNSFLLILLKITAFFFLIRIAFLNLTKLKSAEEVNVPVVHQELSRVLGDRMKRK